MSPQPRLRTQSGPPDDEGGEHDGGGEVGGELALDGIALAIGRLVERILLRGLDFRSPGDDRDRAKRSVLQRRRPCAVVGGVGGQAPPAGTALINAVADSNVAEVRLASLRPATGRARASAMAWICAARPPRESGQSPAPAPLPPAAFERTGLWPSHCRWLDHRRGSAGHQQLQSKRRQTPRIVRAAKAIADCRRRPVDGRAILPATASFQNVNDPADHPPIIGPSSSGLVLGRSGPMAPHCASLNQNSPATIQALQPDSD